MVKVDLETKFKDPKDRFKIVIVRDTWLTGFAASFLPSMYADQTMQGHGIERRKDEC